MIAWRNCRAGISPAELVAACHLVALTRYDVPLNWERFEAALPGIRERVTLLDMPEIEIASHQIQERVRRVVRSATWSPTPFASTLWSTACIAEERTGRAQA